MPKTNVAATEIDLEAVLAAAIGKIFPLGPRVAHQLEFTLHLGHKEIGKNGRKSWVARGRADVLVTFRGEPLAIFEFKRPGLALQDQDEVQGLSYARLLQPKMAPLLVVTNGEETRFIETATGTRWVPEGMTEKAAADLIANAGKVAADALKMAVHTLMGQDPEVWSAGVAAASDQVFAEMTATPEHPARPLGLLRLPREASERILEAAQSARFIILSGAPLSGKTNVLAEVVQALNDGDGAALMVERGQGAVSRRIADILARALNWPITPEEARDWVRRLSLSEGPPLLIAIDGIDPDDAATVLELEDLTSATFGPRLTILAALDDHGATRLLQGSNGYGESPLGRRTGSPVTVGPLSRQEFSRAAAYVQTQGIGIMDGGQYSADLRQPWLLQALAMRLAALTGPGAGVVPSVMGVEVLNQARASFTDPELRRRFQGLARAMIADAQDRSRPPVMALQLASRFFARRETLDRLMKEADVQWLLHRGFVVPGLGEHDIPIVTIALPELAASELARVLAEDLAEEIKNSPAKAVDWLAGAASNFALGDVVAARAIFDVVDWRKSLPFNFIAEMAKSAPRRGRLSPDGRYAAWTPEAGEVEVVSEDGDPETIENLHPWLILSHVASRWTVADFGRGPERIDRHILLTVGRADFILRQPGPEFEFAALPVHEMSDGGEFVCYSAGIVEAVTLNMILYLQNETRTEADRFVDEALEEDDLYLTARLDLALRMLVRSGKTGLADWASDVLTAKVQSAMAARGLHH
jgi:hypothetical protein